MSFMSNLRDFAHGKINEDALQASTATAAVDEDISEYENDEEFMQECTALCMPTFIQMMMMDENAEQLDESVKDALVTLQNYLVGQGVISEAATVAINNPKINVVRLNKGAQIKRLTTILTLKMGRKADHKAYRKYKLGQKIKKMNLEELRKLYGAKAERLAKKLWQRTRKTAKVAAVVEEKKPATSSNNKK